MILHTDYHGEVEYTEEDLVCFPDGLFGFPELKQYLPLFLNEDDDSIILMQSVENPLIAFASINPVYLYPEYSPCLTPEELSFLGVSNSGELSYYVLCTVRDNYLESTVNLKAPLAIHPETRRGIQVILENSDYTFRHKMDSFPNIGAMENSQDRSARHADSQKKKE